MRSLSGRFVPFVIGAVVPLTVVGVTAAVTRMSTGGTGVDRLEPAAVSCPAPGGVRVPPVSVSGAGTGIVIRGNGWGHGLGMSQYGAQGAARLGCSHAQILAAYYAGTRLARSAMTAPVELTLATTARRSTVATEATPVTWTATGHTLVQPARTSWTVTTASGRTTLTSATGARLLQIGAGASLQVRHAGAVVRLRSFTSTAATAGALVDLRLRWGTLAFAASSSATVVSETIVGDTRTSAVDRYLWGLGEVPVTWPQEALRAQADAARTYLTHSWDPRKRRYVIGVTTAAQVYRGASQEDTDVRYHSPWHGAVTATHNEIIVDSHGTPIWAMYSSSDGGRAESRAYVYGSQSGYGYLVGLDDSRWDLASDNSRRSWAKVFDPADLARRLGFSSVSAVSIAASGTTARGGGLAVTGIRTGHTVTVRFTGDQVRGKLGLLSPVISVSWTAARPAPPAVASKPNPPPASSSATRTTGNYTSSACNGQTCATATARFSGTRALIGIREVVQDRTCNGRRAYARLLIRYTNGSSELTTVRYAAARCRPPASTYAGLSWRAPKPIAGFAVVTGEVHGRALTGRYVDNPNT